MKKLRLSKGDIAALGAALLFTGVILGYGAVPSAEQGGYSVRVSQEAANAVAPQQEQAGSAAGATVNINTADAEALESLDGIGETLAGRIIEYRETHGPFGSIEDITEVKGIGEGTLADIRDYITVEEDTP